MGGGGGGCCGGGSANIFKTNWSLLEIKGAKERAHSETADRGDDFLCGRYSARHLAAVVYVGQVQISGPLLMVRDLALVVAGVGGV